MLLHNCILSLYSYTILIERSIGITGHNKAFLAVGMYYFIDFWQLKKNIFFQILHNSILRAILFMLRLGEQTSAL